MPDVNTGKKIFNKLKQVYADTGVPTGEEKDNVASDPDYIPASIDTTTCATPFPVESLVNNLSIIFVNSSSQSIGFEDLIVRPESDPSVIYMSKPSWGLLQNNETPNLEVDQIDDLTRMSFKVTGLSKSIRTKMEITYQRSDETSVTEVYETRFVKESVINVLFNTERVENTDQTNHVVILFTEDPIAAPVTYPKPIVTAGSNQTFAQPTSTATLNGTVSTTGTILSISWTQLLGPNNANILTPDGITSNVTGLISKGVYKFQIKATDALGQSSISTVQITVTANPLGLINTFVDPVMPDDTFAINQITLYNLVTPVTSPVQNLLSAPINKSNGVVLKTPLKGTYRVEITIVGDSNDERSLVLQWGGGSNTFAINIPMPGIYVVENVVIDEGANGLAIMYKATPTSTPTKVIVYGSLNVATAIEEQKNVLPNGKVITNTGPVTISFFTNESGTTPVSFTGRAIYKIITTNNLTSSSSFIQSASDLTGAQTKVIENSQRLRIYDYDVSNDLKQDLSFAYELLPGEGYLIIP